MAALLVEATMPNLNQHSARMGPPDQFRDIRTRPTNTPGVTVLVGIRAGKDDVESFRFDADQFTPKQAQAWLRAKGKHPIAFEPASAIPNQGEGMSGQRRAAARMVERSGKHRSEAAAMMGGDRGEWTGEEDGGEKSEPPTDSDLAADATEAERPGKPSMDADEGEGAPEGERTRDKGAKAGAEEEPPDLGEPADGPDSIAVMLAMPAPGARPKPPFNGDALAAMRDARKGKKKGKAGKKAALFGGKQAPPFGRKPSPDEAQPV